MHLNPKQIFLRRALHFAAAIVLFVSVFGSATGRPAFGLIDPYAQAIASSDIHQTGQTDAPASPDNPEGTWTPGAGTSFTYPLYTNSISLSVDVLLSFAPNLASAGYFLYDPASGATQSFSASATAIPGGARITANNIPILSSGQDVQFFIFPQAGGAADFSPRYKIFTLMKMFIPFAQRPGLLEPNNNACDAVDASADTIYTGRNDDNYDWFSIDLNATSDYSITLTGFNTPGYIELWTGSNCNSLSLSQVYLLQGSNNPVVARAGQAAGTYYFRIVSVAPDMNQYTFSWVYTETHSELEPNNTACQATSAAAGTVYTGRDDDAQDWFTFSITGTARATFNVNAYGSTGLLEVYSSTNGACAQIASAPIATKTLSSGNNRLIASGLAQGTYFAAIKRNATPTDLIYTFSWTPEFTSVEVMEPNNTACTAATISLDRSYQTYAEDADDWFVYTLPITGRMQIVFSNVPAATTNPVTTDMWPTIYRENSDCNSLTRIDLAAQDHLIRAASGGNYVMAMQNQRPARYYIHVNRKSAYNNTQPYQIRVTQGDIGVWAPKVMSCESQEFGCSGQSNGQVVVYYYGMLVGTQITLRMGGLPCGLGCGCPIGQSTPSTGFTTVSESGAYTFTNMLTGYYGLYANATNSTYGTWGDEKPIKMGCQFLFAADDSIGFNLMK